MRKIIHTLLLVAAMLLPLATNAQTDSMLVNVAVNNATMGTTNPAPGAHYFHQGDTCHVIAVPNDGYVLTGWRIQMSFMGTQLTDTTLFMPVSDVFDLVGILNGGTGWVVQTGHHFYVFNVTANFVEASQYDPDSMLVNVAVNNDTMGTTNPAPGAYRYGVGDTVSVLAVANDGYHLTGWDINVSLGGQDLLDTTINTPVADIFPVLAMVLTGGNAWVVDPLYVNATISVTANFIDAGQYVPDSMIVNVSVNNPVMGTTIPGTGTHYFAVGDTCHVAAVANSGYHLTGWTIQISVGGAVALDTTINIAIRDVFDMVLLIEEIRSRGNMSAYELIQMLAQPIGDWVVEPLYAQATFNLTANFAAGNPASTHITYAVLNHDTSRGTINPAEGTYTIYAGDPVVVSATPNNGYELSAWIMEYTYTYYGIELPFVSDTIRSNNPAFANPVRFLGVMQQMLDTIPQIGMYVTAVFTPRQYTLHVNTADANMGRVEPHGSINVNYGGTFTATAYPNDGYHFVHWVDETGTVVSTDNPYSFSVTDDIFLLGVFGVGGYYTVTVDYDATMGTVTGIPTEAVLEGTQVTLTAEANEGYRFTGWSITPGYASVVTDNPLTVTVTEDVSLSALFEQVQGIDNVEGDDFQVYSLGNQIVVKGAENRPVSLFDITGRCISESRIPNSEFRIDVPAPGVYMVKVGTAAAKRVVVMP